jgi:hypothetical protein
MLGVFPQVALGISKASVATILKNTEDTRITTSTIRLEKGGEHD